MKTLYEASNGVEAHMILNLLEQQGINGRVDGEFLQGGIGELPAAGLVRVMVSEEDYAAAKPIVEQWDKAQPARVETPLPDKAVSRPAMFLVGLVIGILCTYGYFRTPVTREGIDHNRDGVLDDKWTYAPSGLAITNEADRNMDGKIDYVATFGRDGMIETANLDDNFDGVFESSTAYRQGNGYLSETDTDGDGYRDLKANYVSGVLVSAEYIYPATGYPRKVEYFKLGKPIYAETDTDNDGKLDQRINYDEYANATSTASIK